MRPDHARRLLALADEIAAADAERRMLRERLGVQRSLLDELRLRTFVAETPLADQEFHLAAEDLDRIEARLGELEIQVGALRAEERRLAEEASADTATPASA